MNANEIPIQRVIFKAHPAKNHPNYFEWQTATVCVFVAENDQQMAMEKALMKLRLERWEMINLEDAATLIEERVRWQGGEVWDAYQEAQEKGIFFLAFLEAIAGDKQKCLVPQIPSITEKFIDAVVARRRTPTDNRRVQSRIDTKR